MLHDTPLRGITPVDPGSVRRARDFRRSQLRSTACACGLTLRIAVVTRATAPNVTAVLKIAREHVDAMIAHARDDHPDEACGVIVGPEGSDVPTRLVRMINAERSPTFFRFDPEEQFALYKEMSAAGEEIVVVYHSHTATEAYPSRTDISLASEPQAHYVIISTRRVRCRSGSGQRTVLPHRRWCGHGGGDRRHGIGPGGQSLAGVARHTGETRCQ